VEPSGFAAEALRLVANRYSSGLIVAQCGEGQAESFVYAVKVSDDGKSAEKVYEVIRTGGYVPLRLRWAISCFFGRRTVS
jgi:hypothetical protein